MKKISLLLCTCFASSLYGMNFLRPYNTLLRPIHTSGYSWQANFYAETGFGDTGFNSDNRTVNVLQIWNPTQNGLAMLTGFPECSKITQLLNEIDATDDGVRGHFCVNGQLDLRFAGAFGLRYYCFEDWIFSFYLPFFSMQLKDVQFIDQTGDASAQDVRTRELLTNDFFERVCCLGGLELGPWDRTGPGDISVFVDWAREFPQQKPLLRNVRLNWRIGLGLPTGFRRDEDKLFALPFGWDGAVFLPFGFGLDLFFAFWVKTGFDVQLTHVFGNQRDRRIKTSPDQTELILLQKAEAFRDFGLTQRFNLYVEFHEYFKGLSFLLGYQYFKHGEDKLVLAGNCFSDEIANTAQMLRAFTMHQIFVKGTYSAADYLGCDAPVVPHLDVYLRLPFNGTRAALVSSIGFIVAVDF